MKKFLIVANSDKEDTLKIAKNILEYLENSNANGTLIVGYVDKNMVDEATECAIVLGGDGTLLMAARNLVGYNIPFIGINCGNLGFLAEAKPDAIYDTLDRLLKDDYSVESRMMLTGTLIRDGEELFTNIALNDIVIRSGSVRVIDINVYVNGLKLNEYRADGMIVATPTGSTAYSMSAGGPIVKPSANLLVLTPICPHTLNTRSIVFDSTDVIELEVLSKRGNKDDIRSVYFDGDSEIILRTGDRITIKKSEIYTDIIKLSSKSFLEILKRKMSDNEER